MTSWTHSCTRWQQAQQGNFSERSESSPSNKVNLTSTEDVQDEAFICVRHLEILHKTASGKNVILWQMSKGMEGNIEKIKQYLMAGMAGITYSLTYRSVHTGHFLIELFMGEDTPISTAQRNYQDRLNPWLWWIIAIHKYPRQFSLLLLVESASCGGV